jgi:hypothetical protein
MQNNLLNIKEASQWASEYLNKNVSPSNISYLVQYGKIKKHTSELGTVLINLEELRTYYDSYLNQREKDWKEKLGSDLNWSLSFADLREIDTTKHVHRLHPYKGKFIPQLVEYFLDEHTDNFKTEAYFRRGDVVLDPFSGSGTTLVQAKEMDIHAIGIDISNFNSMIALSKIADYDFAALYESIRAIDRELKGFEFDHRFQQFEMELDAEIKSFNSQHFVSPEFKYEVNQGRIDEVEYGKIREDLFLGIYNSLLEKYGLSLQQAEPSTTFLDKWYTYNVRQEIQLVEKLIGNLPDSKRRRILSIILSRTMRSCRATTHSDLATLKEPQLQTYYCHKHYKICRPLFSIKNMFSRYANDTLKRLVDFDKLKTESYSCVITADSRNVDIFEEVREQNIDFYNLLLEKRIRGIFSSPPYVGQIDYHEQHAYAYALFQLQRDDESEIGPLFKGQGKAARQAYVEGIAQVLRNASRFMTPNYDIFLVANDKHNLYPDIAKKAEMKIVNQFKRPVLNRTERDKSPYAEIIFHFKSLSH